MFRHFFQCPAAPWAAYVPILLSDVEQEERPSGSGDSEVGAALCDGEAERAYTAYAPYLVGESTENVVRPLRKVIFFLT